MYELSPDLISQRLGVVTLEPAGPVVAGSLGQWRLVYTVGSYGLDEGGTIKLAQRMVCDWEIPQFDQPTASGYTTVTTTGPAKLRAYYHRKAYARPWSPCLVIDVYDGTLAPGDTVTITLGDQSQGSPGMRAQTYQEQVHEFRFMVDPTNAAAVSPLPTSPKFPIIAGDRVELVCILPSQAVVGQPVEIFVKGQDRWVNPTPAPARKRTGLGLVFAAFGVAFGLVVATSSSSEPPDTSKVVAVGTRQTQKRERTSERTPLVARWTRRSRSVARAQRSP